MWSETVAKEVSSLRGVSGVTIWGTETAPELQVVIKAEQAKELGINAATLAARIGPMLAKAVTPSPVDAHLPVVVRRATASEKPTDLSQLKISLPNGEQVPVVQVADVYVRAALQNIIRVDFERAVEVRIQADSQTSRHNICQALKSIGTSTRPPDLGSEFRYLLEGAKKE